MSAAVATPTVLSIVTVPPIVQPPVQTSPKSENVTMSVPERSNIVSALAAPPLSTMAHAAIAALSFRFIATPQCASQKKDRVSPKPGQPKNDSRER
jgi:hypothetical protein